MEVKKIKKFILNHLLFIKVLIIALMGFVAFFIDKENKWDHWSWVSYGILTVVLLFFEYFEHGEKSLTPLGKVKKYLLDFDGWQETDENHWHYIEHPEFIICPTEEESWEITGSEHWVRACINPRAFVRPMQIKYSQTVLRKVVCIYFDEMRGMIPAPKATFVRDSDQKFFWSISGDSFDFLFLQFLLRRTKEQIFKEGLIDPRMGKLVIAVFRSSEEKDTFLQYLYKTSVSVESRHAYTLNTKNSLITDHDRDIIAYSRAVIEKLEKHRTTRASDV